MFIKQLPRHVFCSALTSAPEDKFGKTFIAKADMGKGFWEQAFGVFDRQDQLLGGCIATTSKSDPKIVNLQLLHTLGVGRGRGVGKMMVEHALLSAIVNGSTYFRVSSEIPALHFYSKLGFRFWGRQKSGCGLSMFKLTSTDPVKCLYDYNDPYIQKAVHRKGKGGCVEVFPAPIPLYI